jgi:hypothetical protein
MTVAPALALTLFSAAAALATQLPDECQPPAASASALHKQPSAKSYDAASRARDP